MKKGQDRTVLEASLETSEAAIDLLASNEVLADIPIVGTALKILKAADSVRDRAFSMKLERFAKPLSGATDSERQRFRDKLRANQEETRRVGETLFLVIDRLADVDKPSILGYVFISYLNGLFPYSDLRLMSQAIDMAYADDLDILVETESFAGKLQADWMQRLASAGLTESLGGTTWGDVGAIYYRVTELGEKLRNAYQSGRHASG